MRRVADLLSTSAYSVVGDVGVRLLIPVKREALVADLRERHALDMVRTVTGRLAAARTGLQCSADLHLLPWARCSGELTDGSAATSEAG